eukprot:1020446-Prorocentrum_minimum.AAC.4
MHAPTRPHMAPRQGPTAPSHAVSNYPVTRYPLGVGVWLLRLASPLLRFTSSSVVPTPQRNAIKLGQVSLNTTSFCGFAKNGTGKGASTITSPPVAQGGGGQ